MIVQPCTDFNLTEHSSITHSSVTGGATVTLGASSSNGSWSEVLHPTYDTYGIRVSVQNTFASGVATNSTFDIGVDPSGGTSYTTVIENVLCGYAPAVKLLARNYFFPMFFPAGSSIAIRGRRSPGSTQNATFLVTGYQQPSNPAMSWIGRTSETFGYTSGCLGTGWTATSGSNTPTSWVSLGTTTKALNYWVLSASVNSAAYNGVNSFKCDVAYSLDGGTTFVPVLGAVELHLVNTSEQAWNPMHPQFVSYVDVPVGAVMYARSRCWAVNTLNNAISATLIGIGG